MIKLYKRIVLTSIIASMFLLISSLNNEANAQCSSLVLKAVKTIRNYNNSADSTIYMDKDSSCDYYTVRLKISGYASGSQFKYYFGATSINQYADTASKQYVGYNGYINIKVEVLDGNGNLLCTIVRDSMYKLGVATTPNVTFSPSILCNGPDTLTFIDNTPNIVSSIIIIDGTVYQNKSNIKHKITTTGCKKVIVSLKNTDGCTISKTYDSAVCVYNKVSVDFSTPDTAGCLIHKAKFTPSVSSNGTTLTSYLWNFPSGNPSTDTNLTPATITYSSVGQYDVSLQVTNSVGCTFTEYKKNYLRTGDSAALQVSVNDTSFCKGEKDTFIIKNFSSYPGGVAYWYSSNNYSVYQPSAKSDTFVGVFANFGISTQQLRFTLNGCKKYYSWPVRVLYPKASASTIDGVVKYCSPPYTFRLKADTSTVPKLGTNTYKWEVSDSTGTIGNPNKTDSLVTGDTLRTTPLKGGVYTVRLTVTNTNGCSDVVTLNNFLSIKDPVATMSISPKTLCPYDSVLIKNTTAAFSIDTIRKEFTLFNKLDTSQILRYKLTSFNSPKDTMRYKFTDTGKYLVQLMVYTDFGCRDTIWDTITVASPKIDSIHADTNFICAGNQVSFTSYVSPKGFSSPVLVLSETWYYKNTNSTVWLTGAPSIVFNDWGIYDVAYVVNKPGFCKDSIARMKYIKVSSIGGDFKAVTTSGCKNTAIKFDTLNVDSTNHPIKNSRALKYSWSVNPSTNVTIANPNSASTNITFGDNGSYDVTLTIKNADSCTAPNIVKVGYVTIGVVAGFNIPQGGCMKEDISITDGSQNSPSSVKWTVLPASMASKVIFDSTVYGTPTSPKVKFLDSGCYQIRQTVYKGTCSDTISHTICIQRSVPKYYASDTFFYCAPQLARFYAGSSINAVLYKWDFGDGNTLTTTSDSAVNYYQTNDSCKDVTLITTDANGCSDTLFIPCYLRFNGPVPKFDLINSIGCEPLNISIVDKSYKIKQPTFDFGDGTTQTNGSVPKSHTYYSPGNSLYSVYYPSLSATDGAGCYAQYPLANNKNPDSVVVYKRSKAYFRSDTTQQCEPMEVQLTDTSKYTTVWRWTITPSTFSYLHGTDSTSQFPIIHFNPGTYTVKLWVTNGSGCADSIIKTNHIVSHKRAKVSFSVNDTAECNSLFATFTNTSTNASSYSWDFGDTKTSTAINPTHTYTPGYYNVKLWANNVNNCADSLTYDTLVEVYDIPQPKFGVDKTQGCEPFTAQFTDSSTITDSVLWDFGDGTFSNLRNPSHSYIPGTYTVKQYCFNLYGCVDSLTKNNLITVYRRAVPSYTVSDSLGCDTLVVVFTNGSSYANSYKWDFGNGVTSTLANPKIGFGVGQYNVKLWANNLNNCPDSITITTRVIVNDKPKPKMYTPIPTGCEPFTASLFGDSTLYANNYQWDIDLDGTIDFTVQNPVVSLPPGKHSVKLIATSSLGCVDSTTVINLFTVYIKPVADFVSNKPSTCFGDNVSFTDVSTSDVALTNWLWDFGDATTDTNQFPAAHIYATAGFKTVAFYITNSNGCKDTITKNNFIFVDDSIPPVVTQLTYVTVDTTSGFEQIIAFWDINTDSSFDDNKLYRLDPNPLNVYSSSNTTDTTFNDGGANLVNSQTYSYFITTTDTCKYTSLPSVVHTTMLLKASTYAPMTNLVSWTPYIGWGVNGIAKYEVYRNTGLFGTFGTLNLFKTMQATDTSIVDSLLCDSDYQYVVLAYSRNGLYQSLSNKSMNHPPYSSPDTAVGITRSTVVNDRYTHTSWNGSAHSAIKNYILDRSIDGGNTWINRYGIVANNQTSFTDVNVDVKDTSYTYRVSVEDYCGSYSPTSTDIGKTILLKARVENEYVHLAWTPYEFWANGIKEYKVQLDFNGVWQTLATLNTFDTPYIDKEVHEEITTNYCYRIMALENDVFGDTSISNIGCAVVPSRIWIPNAFTPNDRGPLKNEVFKPILISVFNKNLDDEIKKFEFIVYDRWGQKVFYTTDHTVGWDGTSRNKLMPDGVYMWVLRGRGMDGYEYSKNGVVHLIR
ncbi:MAG: PKD domain-containing protein [Bacteroidota bacterium]|nr:PKD domain-containing protein [Bacteroidota bacterium]